MTPGIEKDIDHIRWTINKAATEFRKDARAVRKGLREIDAKLGSDGKYSSDDIAKAIFDLPRMEYLAKQAQFQRQIAEAKIAELKRAEQEGKMVDIKLFRTMALDMLLSLATFIRHTKMSEEEKQQAINSLTAFEVTDNANNGSRRKISGNPTGDRATDTG